MHHAQSGTGSLAATALRHFDQAELKLCCMLNRTSGFTGVRALFRAVSWLGNGWIWYAMLLWLPIAYGSHTWPVSLHMALTAGAGALVYTAIKHHTVRERPYIAHAAIRCGAPPLDRYSFPSGHTLHAVSFTLMMMHHFPEWTAVLVAFTVLVALSRMVLGLHYPSDVAAGALIGAMLATASLKLASLFG